MTRGSKHGQRHLHKGEAPLTTGISTTHGQFPVLRGPRGLTTHPTSQPNASKGVPGTWGKLDSHTRDVTNTGCWTTWLPRISLGLLEAWAAGLPRMHHHASCHRAASPRACRELGAPVPSGGRGAHAEPQASSAGCALQGVNRTPCSARARRGLHGDPAVPTAVLQARLCEYRKLQSESQAPGFGLDFVKLL